MGWGLFDAYETVAVCPDKSAEPASTRSIKEADAKRLLKNREGEISEGKIPGIYFDRVRFDELAEDFLSDYRINQRKSLVRAERSIEHLEDRPAPNDVSDWDYVDAVKSSEEVLISHSWDEVRRLMWNLVGIIRSDHRLELAAEVDGVAYYDDSKGTNAGATVHPTSPVAAAALAVGEYHNASGEEFLTALIAGDEITCTFVNVLPVAVPVNNFWALLMLTLMLLATGWYFRPASMRR